MPKVNNFDLLRLLAALQVAVHHAAAHLGTTADPWGLLRLTGLFPGVPIFFFVSGFLISKAFENNPAVSEFALNRALRIYPGLLCCLAVSIGMVWLSGYLATARPPLTELLTWLLAQASIGQFYNPGFLKHYGVGVLNGSVWTITVELQFYVLVPVLYALSLGRGASAARSNRWLLALTLLFLLLNRAYVLGGSQYAGALWYKLAGVSFVPWFYMFLTGILAQRNFAWLQTRLAGRFLPLLIGYCVLTFTLNRLLGWSVANDLNPLFFGTLALLAFAAAFSRPGLSDRLLRRNDISYGVYLYHMPVVNLMLTLGIGGTTSGFVLTIAATLLLALGSWLAVEKPALTLKRHALYGHSVAKVGPAGVARA